MTNPIIDLQKTAATKDPTVELFRHSGASIACKGTSSVSWACK